VLLDVNGGFWLVFDVVVAGWCWLAAAGYW